jgi:transposase InsO family protein
MQLDLDAASPPVPIQLLGVNHIGAEAGNPGITAGVDLPWLQDVTQVDVWTAWGATDRIIFVLDGENRVVTTYDTTANDLSNPANYDELMQILLDAAVVEAN